MKSIEDLSSDLRGTMRRARRLMPDAAARASLREQCVLHVATIDEDGWPYVIPLVVVFPGENLLSFHTDAVNGHFLGNIRRHPRVCVEVSKIGLLPPGRPSACHSALVYTSVVARGRVRNVDDEETRISFFDWLVEKYGDSRHLESGYPFLDRNVLYPMTSQLLTGERLESL